MGLSTFLGGDVDLVDDGDVDLELEGGLIGGDLQHRGRHVGLSRGIRGMGHGYWDQGFVSSLDGDTGTKRAGGDGESGVDLHRDGDQVAGDHERGDDGEATAETDSLIFRGRRQRRRSLSF